MIEVFKTDVFATWLSSLRDRAGRAVIDARLLRLRYGQFGDVRPVGEGVWELRIHVGPGYRVYFVRRGDILVVLLCGGDKDTQAADIQRAKVMARAFQAGALDLRGEEEP
ncbi:type II toxin-antitoxin system RelE/ParE family toxin [Caulobacter sp. SSI4214]|uniref:type II toxin-antitoxin system RelE/ParE family toxin n=1 Tax=Caulobacter sp. SSI4214 TaxID=2575739 RepID=UPI0014395951|nr:type II toxin-antitoxin system RelE/ParE family toxin [Caulobacter sp. SSI4214]